MRRPGESSSSRIPRRGWNILARVLRMPLVLSLKMPMSTTKSRALKHISAKSIRFQPRVQYRFRNAPSLSAISSTNTCPGRKKLGGYAPCAPIQKSHIKWISYGKR